MQKKIIFRGENGIDKEFVANIDEIDVTSINDTSKKYLYAVKSVVVDGQVMGMDINNGFTEPLTNIRFIAPDLN